jgi:hypothetical protein
MAVPASGAISLLKIFSEKNEDDYTANNADGENSFSLRGLSSDSNNDSSGGNINLNTTSNPLPDQLTSHKMSEFYGYDHDLNDGSHTFTARIKSGLYSHIAYTSSGNVSTYATGYIGYTGDLSNNGQYSSFSDGSMPGGMVTNAQATSYSVANALDGEHVPNNGVNHIGTKGKFGRGFTDGRACSIDRIWNATSRFHPTSGTGNGGDHKIYISFHGYKPTWQHFYVRWHNTSTWVDYGASSTWPTTTSGVVYGNITPSGSNAISGVTHRSLRHQRTIDNYNNGASTTAMFAKTGSPGTDGYSITEAGYDVRITGISQDSIYWVGPVFTINSISNVSTSGFTSGRNITAAEENRQIEGFIWVNTAFATDPKSVSWNGETLTGSTGREFDLMASSSGLLTSTGSAQYNASPNGTVSLISNNTYNVAYVMAINSHPQYGAEGSGQSGDNNKYVFSTNTRSFTVPASYSYTATITVGSDQYYTTLAYGYASLSWPNMGSTSNSTFNSNALLGMYWQNNATGTDYVYLVFMGSKPNFTELIIGSTNLGASNSWTSQSNTMWRKAVSSNPFASVGSTTSIYANY